MISSLMRVGHVRMHRRAHLTRQNFAFLEGLEWIPAEVPGTAAGALAAAGDLEVAAHNYDDEDWWFRCSFPGAPGVWRLHLNGIATLADVWVNGKHIARTENMYLRTSVGFPYWKARTSSSFAARRWRPSSRSDVLATVEDSSSRAPRAALVPYQPSWSHPRLGPNSSHRGTLEAARNYQGRWTAQYVPRYVRPPPRATGTAASWRSSSTLPISPAGPRTRTMRLCSPAWDSRHPSRQNRRRRATLRGRLPVTGFQHWWPHTHGNPALYEVSLRIGGESHLLSRVGFRRIVVDRSDGGFTFVVNGDRFSFGSELVPARSRQVA